MLSVVLRSSSRWAWRLGRPAVAVLKDVNLLQIYSVPSVRYSNSLVLEAEGPSSDNTVAGEESNAYSWRRIAWWKKILAALKAYKEIYGDLRISYIFVVPARDTRWPSETWGYRLGNGVQHLRSLAAKQKLPQYMEAQLKEMGFVFNCTQSQWDDKLLPALRHYNKVYGNTDVQTDFAVPSGDEEWPRQTWGMKLGYITRNIRNSNAYSQHVRESEEELKQLKFCYGKTLVERDWSEKILPALRIFHLTYHHCLVGTPFKVPSESPWPEEAWGLLLGQIVIRIRFGDYSEQATRDMDLLTELDFAWDHYATNWRDRLIPALEMFEAVNGSCHVFQNFVVPRRDPWPKKVWGLNLGHHMHNWRFNGAYFAYLGRDAHRLEALGFSIDLRARAWEKRVVPLLKTYANVFGEKAIPRDFVIPSESPWPKKMWGVQLGIIVDHNQKHFPDKGAEQKVC